MNVHKGRATGCLVGIGFLVAIIASVSNVIMSSEAVPDKARFLYNARQRIIVPRPESGKTIFFPIPNMPEDFFSEWNGTVTWGELKKKDGNFVGYGLPKGPGWDEFVFYGEPVPLWKQILFNQKSRWDENGDWRY